MFTADVLSRVGSDGEPHRNGTAYEPAGPNQPLPTVSDGADDADLAPPTEPAAGTPAGEKQAATGRTAKGTFAPGNRCGIGNPFSRKLGRMRSAFLDAVTAEDVQALARKLLQQALGGNLAAAKLVLLYAVGQPAPAVDPDRLDLEEFWLIDSWPTEAQILRAFIDGVEPAEAAEFLREVAAYRQGQVRENLTGKLSTLHARQVLGEQQARVGRRPGG